MLSRESVGMSSRSSVLGGRGVELEYSLLSADVALDTGSAGAQPYRFVARDRLLLKAKTKKMRTPVATCCQ
jgi:hypothetical protein